MLDRHENGKKNKLIRTRRLIMKQGGKNKKIKIKTKIERNLCSPAGPYMAAILLTKFVFCLRCNNFARKGFPLY